MGRKRKEILDYRETNFFAGKLKKYFSPKEIKTENKILKNKTDLLSKFTLKANKIFLNRIRVSNWVKKPGKFHKKANLCRPEVKKA